MNWTTWFGGSPRGAAVVAVLACALAGNGRAASASLLSPNQTLYPAPAAADTGGTQVVTETESIVHGSGSLVAGTLTSTVDVNDPSNPFYSPSSPGELTFTFSLVSSGSSTTPINELTLNGFLSAYSIDASYVSGSGNTAPTYISRSNTGLVNFVFETPTIAAGASSMELVLHTNATQYTTAIPVAAVIGNSGIANVATYMPTPEPSSLALASIGMILLAAFSRRRRRV